MADSDFPTKFGPALKTIVGYLTWILLLVWIELAAQEHYRIAGAVAILWVVDVVVAMQWGILSEFAKKVRRALAMTWFLVLLGLGGAAAVGIAIGAFVVRPSLSTTDQADTTGRITWSFDQAGDNYFLGMQKQGDQEARILGFQANGKNTSADPITEFSGFIRSDLTNEQRPILLMAQEPSLTQLPGFPIPTIPDQTYGIPGLAEFQIVTSDKLVPMIGVDGVLQSQFLQEFGPFTLVLKYDGKTIERRFTADQIKAQVALLEKMMRSSIGGSIPRVTRKPGAAPLQLLPFLPPGAKTDQPPPKSNGNSN